jgi:CHAT domain-containing protein
VYPPQHPERARIDMELGFALTMRGELDRARKRLDRAKRVTSETLGAEHAQMAEVVCRLGFLHIFSAEYEEAIAAGERALEIQSRLAGPDHFSLLPMLDAISWASYAWGDHEVGRDARVRALEITESYYGPHHALRRSGAPRVDRLMADLSAARERLANLVVRGPQGDPIERYTAMVEQANVKKEELEAELGTLSREGREESARRQIGLKPIARALSAGSALVAYVRFARHAVGEPTEAQPSASEPYVHPEPVPAYAAFVLGAGDSAPAFAPLGDAGDIDPLVEAWREQATHAPVRLTAASDRADQRYREAADRLRAAIWDPVIAMTGSADRLFVVPDGPLHLVSLSTLTDEDGRYLIEAGPSIHYLSAERELAARRSRDCGGRKLLAIGGPDFDAEGIEIGKALSRRGLRGPQSGIEAFPLGSASPLAGATQEIRDIAELWAGQFEDTGAGVTCLSGAAASEQALKRLAAGHEVLHVATQGYFLRDVGRSSDGALLRSGLLLAGANRRRDASGTEGDGILTAEEVASLDLSCARWAVLSGCESGLGTLRAGEGVLGLRRAFRVAGARTLIMSLWHVEDQATREWMCRLYQHRLEGADTCEAVRRTGLDVLAARREAGLSAHPFYWGAFVAEGDWR